MKDAENQHMKNSPAASVKDLKNQILLTDNLTPFEKHNANVELNE